MFENFDFALVFGAYILPLIKMVAVLVVGWILSSVAKKLIISLLEKVKAACVDKPVINVLMHDTDQKKTTVEALPLIIDYLRSEGYQFMTLSPTSTLIQHSVNN